MAVFTGLGESFVASVPAGAVLGFEDVVEGDADDATPEFSEPDVLRTTGAPLLTEGSPDASFGLGSEPAGAEVTGADALGTDVFGKEACGTRDFGVAIGVAVPVPASFPALSGFGGTVGKRSARISTARAAPF